MKYSTESDTNSIAAQSLPDVGSDKPRKRFFKKFRKRRWSMTMTARLSPAKEWKHEDRNDASTDVSDGNDTVSLSAPLSLSSYDPSDPMSATYESLPDNSLHSCLRLLSSNDLDMNRVGLQRLNLLTSGRTIQDFYRSEEIASFVLVFGGPEGSIEERLRNVFVKMICDDPNTHSDLTENPPTPKQTLSEDDKAVEDWVLAYDPSSDECEGSEISATDDERSGELSLDSSHLYCKKSWVRRSQGKARGVLHTHALKILANALGHVYAADPTAMAEIDLQSSIWKNIIMSLVQNIEKNHSVKATIYSMKILRFLYFVQPKTILPLLKYTLFLDLVGLEEYGEEHGLRMISFEASKLLNYALCRK